MQILFKDRFSLSNHKNNGIKLRLIKKGMIMRKQWFSEAEGFVNYHRNLCYTISDKNESLIEFIKKREDHNTKR